MPLTGSRTVALSVSALALALLPCTRTSHTQAVWHLHLHPAPHPCTVSPGAPPAPAPSPAQHTPHRQRHSLDVELGEDDVGDRCRRGTLAPIGEGCEKRRSTVAELAGQPRYWRAITERLRNFLAFSFHQSSASHSVLYSIWGSARYAASSSACGLSAAVGVSTTGAAVWAAPATRGAKKDTADCRKTCAAVGRTTHFTGITSQYYVPRSN